MKKNIKSDKNEILGYLLLTDTRYGDIIINNFTLQTADAQTERVSRVRKRK